MRILLKSGESTNVFRSWLGNVILKCRDEDGQQTALRLLPTEAELLAHGLLESACETRAADAEGED